MDEHKFKRTFHQFNHRPCAFAKAILTRCSLCSRAQRLLIAEREAVACHSPAGHERCAAYLDLLRAKSLFALRLPQLEGELPHGKEIKVQCGGAQGLLSAMEPGRQAEPMPDIDSLLQSALARFGELERFPYAEIIKRVGRHQARRRRSG